MGRCPRSVFISRFEPGPSYGAWPCNSIRTGGGSSAARRAYEFSPRAAKASRLKNESQQGRPRTKRVTLVKVPARSSHGYMPGGRSSGEGHGQKDGSKSCRPRVAAAGSGSDRPRPRPGQKPIPTGLSCITCAVPVPNGVPSMSGRHAPLLTPRCQRQPGLGNVRGDRVRARRLEWQPTGRNRARDRPRRSEEGRAVARIHSQCFTGEVLGWLRCDCNEQLQIAMQAIADESRGLVIYGYQEGRGIGLMAKLQAYELQDAGLGIPSRPITPWVSRPIAGISACRPQSCRASA